MATYSIDDAHGNQLTTGLQEHNARQVAQAKADSRGEPVYLYEVGSDDEPEEIAPAEVTDEQIEALRTEAGEAGDLEQVALCDRAIDGDADARAKCERVIRTAWAQQD